MARPPVMPAEEKVRIVLSVLAGEVSVAEAARKAKVSEQSVGNWKRQFLEAGKTGLAASKSGPSTREAQLEAEVADLTQALGEAAAYQRERRQLAARRKAAFATEPTGPNQVWQLDFSEFETTTGGTWRIAGCRDYWSKYEHPWHVSPTANQHDAITAIELALADYEQLFGRRLIDACARDAHGNLVPVVTIVTDNGGPFRSFRFEAFIATHPELRHVRTRVRTPGQNGSREPGFGSLKYERLFLEEIDDVLALVTHADAYRTEYNTVRPHEAIAWNRPREVHLGLADPLAPNFPDTQNLPAA